MSKIQNFCGRHISISPKIFLLEMENNDRRRQSFFGTLVQCLLDFTELSPSALVALFMQEMNERKAVTLGDYETCLPNLATYFKSTQFAECKWEVVFGPAETFFRCVMCTCVGFL